MKKGTQIIYVPSHINLRKIFARLPAHIPDEQLRKYIAKKEAKGSIICQTSEPLPLECEKGFVTSIRDSIVFCRFWSKAEPHMLRTVSCSESTPKDRLFVVNTCLQDKVDKWIRHIEKEDKY